MPLMKLIFIGIFYQRHFCQRLFCLSCTQCRQLDDASRSVFKENVRLNEALKYHIKESELLQMLANSMEKEKASLALDKVCTTHRTANRSVTLRQSLDRNRSSP